MSCEVARCRCHFAFRRRAAPHPQKDKKDSEIRFTSGLPEMGRKLPRAALCRAIYLSYRYPISALWHVISPGILLIFTFTPFLINAWPFILISASVPGNEPKFLHTSKCIRVPTSTRHYDDLTLSSLTQQTFRIPGSLITIA